MVVLLLLRFILFYVIIIYYYFMMMYSTFYYYYSYFIIITQFGVPKQLVLMVAVPISYWRSGKWWYIRLQFVINIKRLINGQGGRWEETFQVRHCELFVADITIKARGTLAFCQRIYKCLLRCARMLSYMKHCRSVGSTFPYPCPTHLALRGLMCILTSCIVYCCG